MGNKVTYIERHDGTTHKITDGEVPNTFDATALNLNPNSLNAYIAAGHLAGVTDWEARTMLQNGAITVVPEEE